MNGSDPSWAGSGEPLPAPVPAPLLRLDGFEGPLDLLLELARSQKLDLARISILQLVEQYLAAVEEMRLVRLELAADWLVMAAWLAWLKSRLLLPEDDEAAEEGEAAAGLLQARLLALARIGRAAAWLQARPCLGRDVFARGAPEPLCEIDRSGLALDLGQLLGAYLGVCRRGARRRVYRPKPLRFWTVPEALARLQRLLGDAATGWCDLERFLPGRSTSEADAGQADRQARSAVAATLIAGLELARSGTLELRQDEAFGVVLLRRRSASIATVCEAAE